MINVVDDCVVFYFCYVFEYYDVVVFGCCYEDIIFFVSVFYCGDFKVFYCGL